MIMVKDTLVTLDGRMTNMEGRMTTMEGQMTSMDGRMNNMEGQMTSMDGRMNNMEGQMTSMDGRMANTEFWNDKAFTAIEDLRADMHTDGLATRGMIYEAFEQISDLAYGKVDRPVERVTLRRRPQVTMNR
jgi:hypothetical protein